MNHATFIFFTAALLTSSLATADGNPEAGKAKSAACAGCHNADGNSTSSMFPRLAGQHKDYLFHSLQAYKSGKRKNPIMAGQVQNLTVADMADLAAYYSKQKGLEIKY